ncbi:polysaccharide biosynthesis tyrosine autokinase [Isosphaeraceae bacterium EP7]
MDGIQAYNAAPRPAPTTSYGASAGHLHAHVIPHSSGATKGPADYLRALRRRFWLALALAFPIIMAGSWYALRLTPIYRSVAEIKIERPQSDHGMSALLAHDVVRRDAEADAKFAPNQIQILRSKYLADKVLTRPEIVQSAAAGTDLAAELMANLQHKIQPGTSHYHISLEGTDPAQTMVLLRALLAEFKDRSKEESSALLERNKHFAAEQLNTLQKKLAVLDSEITRRLTSSTTIGPEGKSLVEDEYEYLKGMEARKQNQVDDLAQKMQLESLYPTLRDASPANPSAGALAELERQRRLLTGRMKKAMKATRNPKGDPGLKFLSGELNEVMDEIQQYRQGATAPVEHEDRTGFVIETAKAEVESIHEKAKSALTKLQDSMPDLHDFQNLMEERRRVHVLLAETEGKKQSYDAISQTQGEPVTIISNASEPTTPVRPNRPVYFIACAILGLGLGVGLVCGMEHLDKSVKVPEHLTTGLGLPLFGVIPRIRRTARVHRGGHLWTPGAPTSLEADAYRNLRASLLGLTGPDGPMVTLLITSAKAGEGKSTTALNLAATCARAGERTLLVDVDFRRPSLASAFPDDGHNLGLVDVLAEDIPWSRAVVRTEIPNLDFIPAGDTSKIPVEILGTLEMRQLLKSLSQHHYDRVILDGPAILGLADCRMLGRMVDGALMVVRAGALELRPLQRAKAMLEQSKVPLVGVVFNALSDDWENWSSYGREALFTTGLELGREARADGSDDEAAALPAGSGSFRS